MSAVRCWKCDSIHPRPVGRKCAHGNTDDSAPPPIAVPVVDSVDSPSVLDILKSIQTSVASLGDRVKNIEGGGASSVNGDESRVPLPSAEVSNHSAENRDQQEDRPMPSFNVLRNSQDIQQQVEARMRELQSNSLLGTNYNVHSEVVKKSSKSGRVRGSINNPSVHIVWPHELVYVGASRQTPSYDDLSPAAFIAGYLKALKGAPESDKEAMLNFAIGLFDQAIDLPWPVMRGASAVVFQELEQSRLN